MVASVCDIIPTNPSSEIEQTKAVIQVCIDHYAYEDALFICELLYERAKSDQTLLLWTETLMKLNRLEEVYAILKPINPSAPKLVFLFAKCCFDLRRYDECERILTAGDKGDLNSVLKNTQTAPFARQMLSNIYCDKGRQRSAVLQSVATIRANPFLWSSVKRYVQLGGREIEKEISAIENKLKITSLSDGSIEMEDVSSVKDDSSLTESSAVKRKTPVLNPLTPKMIGAPRKNIRGNKNDSSGGTPEARRSSRLHQQSSLIQQDLENAGGRVNRITIPKLAKTPTFRGGFLRNELISPHLVRADRTLAMKKSSREMTKPLAARNANSVRSIASSNNSNASGSTGSLIEEKSIDKDPDNDRHLSEIFLCIKRYGQVETAISKYKWNEALSILGKLVSPLSKHPLAFHMRARILFEQNEYAAARRILGDMRCHFPHRVEGMELLSTAMWHLQDTANLAGLARILTSTSRNRPHTWCVAGNSYSLQRQHTLAISCIEKAISLDPHFAYAYTLLGHELITIDELDKAEKAFRKAVTLSPGDYKALYGLGLVYERKEDLDNAKDNMTKALTINPTSRALMCNLARIEQTRGNTDRAMALLTKALELNVNDVACRFNRARLLFDLKKNDECLKELDALKGLSPEEPHIFQLLGKVHRRLGNAHLSLLNICWATDMDPRGEQRMNHGTGEMPMDDDSFLPDNHQ